MRLYPDDDNAKRQRGRIPISTCSLNMYTSVHTELVGAGRPAGRQTDRQRQDSLAKVSFMRTLVL